MEIRPETVVTLTYSLANDEGDIMDSATQDKPFAFIHGVGQTLPAFDKELNGLKEGDTFKFRVPSDEAYGQYNEGMMANLPKANFEGAPEGALAIGNTLPMADQDGNPLFGTVLEITDEYVRMDFNHPMAGEDLNFSGAILEVREATKEELDHGHVHGEHGVHH